MSGEKKINYENLWNLRDMKKKKGQEVRKSFMGPIITGKNRKEYLEKFRQDFILNVAKAGNPKGYNQYEIEKLSMEWAMFEVRREMKHLEAYIKGKSSYTIYGRKYPVLNTNKNEEEE